MKRFASSRVWQTGLALSLCGFLAACASGPAKRPNVEDRAKERLDLYLAQDYAAVYNYLTPAYRSSVSSVAYQRSELLRKVRYTGGELINSDCLEDVCKVKISMDYVIFAPVPGLSKWENKTVITQNWIWTEGNWYLSPNS